MTFNGLFIVVVIGSVDFKRNIFKTRHLFVKSYCLKMNKFKVSYLFVKSYLITQQILT